MDSKIVIESSMIVRPVKQMKGEGLWYLTPLSTIFQYRYGKLKRYILKIITFNVHFFGK